MATKHGKKYIAAAAKVDLNSVDVEGAEKIIAGTARSMGITITD